VLNLVEDRAEGGARRWGGRRVLTGGDGGRCSTGWGNGGWRGSSPGASRSRGEANGEFNWGRAGSGAGAPRRAGVAAGGDRRQSSGSRYGALGDQLGGCRASRGREGSTWGVVVVREGSEWAAHGEPKAAAELEVAGAVEDEARV
jgi:hypothetical protein